MPLEERSGEILHKGSARVTLIPFQMAAPFDATLSLQVLWLPNHRDDLQLMADAHFMHEEVKLVICLHRARMVAAYRACGRVCLIWWSCLDTFFRVLCCFFILKREEKLWFFFSVTPELIYLMVPKFLPVTLMLGYDTAAVMSLLTQTICCCLSI